MTDDFFHTVKRKGHLKEELTDPPAFQEKEVWPPAGLVENGSRSDSIDRIRRGLPFIGYGGTRHCPGRLANESDSGGGLNSFYSNPLVPLN